MMLSYVLPVFLLYISIFQEAESKRQQPNIIFFLADDLGYGDLGFTGHPTSETPNLDELVKSSMFFTNFYSASSLCSPSRAAILTGEYPVQSGIYPGVFFPDSTGGLDPQKLTITKYLKKNHGYRSALIGKWHLGVGNQSQYLPTRSSNFDYYYGIPYAHDMCPCPKCFPYSDGCLSACHDQYVGCPLFENDTIIEQPVDLSTLTKRYTSKAINFLKENLRDQSPFFLMYAFHQPHHPQFSGTKYFNKTIRGGFGDSLSEMDDAVGDILGYLTESGLDDKTLVIFTSDNGPSLSRHERGGCAGPFRCGKATTYEGGMRVPFMAHWKSFIKPRVSHELMTALDIFPTIKTMVDYKYENSAFGFNFVKHILRESEKGPRESFLYFPGNARKSIGPYAFRHKNYKLHLFTQGNSLSDDENFDRNCTSAAQLTIHNPPLLYDLNLDPGERYPLDITQHTSLISDLKYKMSEILANIQWASSEMHKPSDKAVEPCCTPGCNPLPKCCKCGPRSFNHPLLSISKP